MVGILKNLNFHYLALLPGLFLIFNPASLANNKKPLSEINVQNLDAHPPVIDSNEDGRADIWQEFSLSGKLEKAQYDTDFDGKVDEWLSYQDNLKERIVAKDKKRKKTIEHFGTKGEVAIIEIFDELSSGKWQLIERQTYIQTSKQYKIEQFIDGNPQKEFLTPAELLK